MKVLFVARKKPGKNEISPFILSQAQSLMKANIDVTVFESSGNVIISYFKNAIKLKKLNNRKEFNIIHSHYSFQGLLSIIALPKQNHIISFMGTDLHVILEKNKSIKKRISKSLLQYLFANLIKFKAVIVKSKNLYDIIAEKHDQCFIVPNGVDFLKFFPMDKIQARKKIGWKVDDIIVGFFSASERDENKNIELARKSVNSIEINKNIQLKHIFGIKHEELVYYYNAIDVMLFTSKTEGSPNVIKEALICNCPIVSVDVGDVRERLKNVSNSYVCDYDSSKISNCLLKVIESGKRSNGRSLRHSLKIENVANQLIDIYNNSIN